MSQASAVVFGAAVSGVIGILVVVTQQWLTRSHQTKTDRVNRLSGFAASTWALSLALGRIAHAALEQKHEREEQEHLYELINNFNTFMAQIQLLDEGEVYLAAYRLDRALATLVGATLERQFTTEGWRAERVPLTAAVNEFQRIARQTLGSPPSPPIELNSPPSSGTG